MARAVAQLETAFAQWLGAHGAVATGYGRGAIWLATKLALEDHPAAPHVLVPDFVCAQVPQAVRRAGGIPVFFPVQRDLTVREADLEAAITPATRTTILVHYYGRVLPGVEELVGLCRRRGIVVIEDCALALGAGAGARPAGRLGDLAAFSFTKSDWCYGGGMVSTQVAGWTPRLRQLREEYCRPAPRLAFFYGLLRRVDFAANYPSRSRVAGHAGRCLEHGLAALEPSLQGNFFDAGRFDALMPEFCARRALRILTELDSKITHRRTAQASFAAELRKHIPGAAAGLASFPGRTDLEAGDTAAFLLLSAAKGCADEWMERAEKAGFTLRLSWPAYQSNGVLPPGRAAEWLRRHLIIVECTANLSSIPRRSIFASG